MTIGVEDILQHLPLVLYLVAVTALSVHLVPYPHNARAIFFILLATVSLCLTWYYMVQFLFFSYAQWHADARAEGLIQSELWNGTRHPTTIWLRETSLFRQAWEFVCWGTSRWWYSAQLCLFTVGTWTVFLFAESSRRPDLRKVTWKYMVLGQIVAISFASSLFLALEARPAAPYTASDFESLPPRSPHPAIAVSPVQPPLVEIPSSPQLRKVSSRPPIIASSPSVLLYACVMVALGTVILVPRTLGQPLFLINLLAMHAIIIVPLLQIAYSSGNPSKAHAHHRKFSNLPSLSGFDPSQNHAFTRAILSFQGLYATIAVLSCILHGQNSYWILRDSKFSISTYGRYLWDTIFIHPAQSSISFDVLCTALIWQLWSFMEIWRHRLARRWWEIVLAFLLVGLSRSLSTAAGVSAFLAMREGWLKNPPRIVKVE